MSGIRLDGKLLAREIEAELTTRVQAINKRVAATPILATILVGDDPSSATYVKMKGEACRRIGLEPLKIELPHSASTEELLAQIDRLNANPRVRGILLQHPVPAQIDERRCFNR